ncbi:hypothetical protein ACPA54_25415 [Uniformispora flossi]|uniref:hypothetical protein n=1 Tax=Uniformispora flossi TaxID=3390723 RepID=UPI003C2B1AC3
MRSVTRKAAVTAGLGAAIVAGAAAPALAAGNGAAGLLDPHAPGLPQVAQENAGNIGPFPVGQLTEQLPTGQVSGLTGGLEQTAQQATGALPTGTLPGVPAVGGLVPGGLVPGLG